MAQFVTTPACTVCGKSSEVEVTEKEFAALNGNEMIQNALPDWSADQRELFISGTHPKCWDDLFGSDE